MTAEEAFDIAPLERAARIFTTIITVFSLGLSVLMVVVAVAARSPVPLVVPCLLLGMLALSLAFFPTGFAVESGPARRDTTSPPAARVPLAGLTAATETAFPRSWRLLGNGGVFRFWGTFRNKDCGSIQGVRHRPAQGRPAEWPGSKLYVTPADREGFRRAVLAHSAR